MLIWGTTFTSTKVLLRDFTPVEVMVIRFVIGYALLWLFSPKWMPVRSLKEELFFALGGITGLTLYFLLENVALTYTLATNVGVIVSVAPMLTALLAQLVIREEKLSGVFFVGFAVAMAGILMISFNGGFALNISPLGDILAGLAALSWAVYSVLSKRISGSGHSIILITRRIFFYGILFLIPCAGVMGFSPNWGRLRDPVIAGNLLFLGLGASALCYVMWNAAVKQLGAVKTSAYIYAIPAITFLSAALILKEPVSLTSVCGTALTLAGLTLSEWKPGNLQRLKEGLHHD